MTSEAADAAPGAHRAATSAPPDRGSAGASGTSVLDASDVDRAISRIAHEILERNRGPSQVVLVGIHTRGVPIAEQISTRIEAIEGVSVPVGTLDIGLYRDDLASRPTPTLGPTSVPDIRDRIVVLVDDVLYTGRTIRAALDALADLGRPSSVQLAVLCDRGHRQLPIRADYVGKNLPTSHQQRVSVKIEPIDELTGVWIS